MIKPKYEYKQNKIKSRKKADQITVDGIPIGLTYSQVTRGRLSVDRKGEVRLVVPHHVELKILEEFLYSKIDWLREHLKKAQLSMPMEREFVDGEFVYLFGKKYDCVVSQAAKNSILKENNTIHMRFKPDTKKEKKLQLLRQWYKDMLHTVIDERLDFWQKKTALFCTDWRIRLMKSCWGSCNPDTRALLFNLRLIKKPLCCIDYIIVHELAHMVSRLHDKAFKSFLDIHLPAWRQLRRQVDNFASDFSD